MLTPEQTKRLIDLFLERLMPYLMNRMPDSRGKHGIGA
jgi:hypothetical protein